MKNLDELNETGAYKESFKEARKGFFVFPLTVSWCPDSVSSYVAQE